MGTYKFYLLNAPPVSPLLLVPPAFPVTTPVSLSDHYFPAFPSSPFIVLRCKSDVSTPHFSTFLKVLYSSSLPQDEI